MACHLSIPRLLPILKQLCLCWPKKVLLRNQLTKRHIENAMGLNLTLGSKDVVHPE